MSGQLTDSAIRIRGRRRHATTHETARPADGVAFGPASAFGMSVWFGLVVGIAELAISIAKKPFRDPSPGFFRMSRHIVWMIPTFDLALFGLLGLGLALAVRVRPRQGARLTAVLLGFFSILTPVLVAGRLHAGACLIFAFGIAYRMAGPVEAHWPVLRRLARRSLPVLACGTLALVAGSLGAHLLRESRAMAAVPPVAANGPDAPNVLLIVLDTVRADRLGLYGYGRDTTPNLARIARRGVVFQQARSTAPWTLPSHASMMTGRWPHELSAGHLGPLDRTHPTLADHLAASGYATAGFVANTIYCAAETGLDRGFARYDDHDISVGSIICGSALGRRVVWPAIVEVTNRCLGPTLTHDRRKDAARVGRDLLAWIQRRGRRPFFAFLNYFDAHNPYVLPHGAQHHFGLKPEALAGVATLDPMAELTPGAARLLSDAYDDCIAYLDEQLGRLFDELDRRGELDNTVVIVTADHGEHLGEHDLYGHASSLYDHEIRVPLIVVAPGRAPAGRVVATPVSLRDLPATVVDLLGLGRGPSFPGRSLARRWGDAEPAGDEPALAEVEPPLINAWIHSRAPAHLGPMKALVSGDLAYIRNGDGAEEVYDLEADPLQLRNLAHTPAVEPRLPGFRDTFDAMTAPAPRAK